jgi:hypothetical protein
MELKNITGWCKLLLILKIFYFHVFLKFSSCIAVRLKNWAFISQTTSMYEKYRNKILLTKKQQHSCITLHFKHGFS